MKKILSPTFCCLIGAWILSGCAATQIALSKKNLDVQTKMSATLFIDPLEDESAKTFYLQAKNTSDKEFEITEELRRSIASKGFKSVASPKQAHYVIQVNVLQVGKSDPTAAEAAMYRGYGADGVALGAATAYVAGAEEDRTIVGAGILGGIGAVIADSLVKDVHFSVITDVQIKERLAAGQKADNTAVHHNQSGTSGGTTSVFSEKSDWRIYQTRILSSANKVNLEFAQASPELKRALVQSISGIF